MEKLTQFVSTSFENNNNNTGGMTEQRVNLQIDAQGASLDSSVKRENELSCGYQDNIKKPKNWLISDIKVKCDSSASVGIDLSLSSVNVLNKVKCNGQTQISNDKKCCIKKREWREVNTDGKMSSECHNNKDCSYSKSRVENLSAKQDVNSENKDCEENKSSICKSVHKCFLIQM